VRPAVRPYGPGDRRWAAGLLEELMGTVRAVRLGQVVDPTGLPGLVAERGGERLGLLTYLVDGDQFEVLSLHAGALDRDRALKPELPEVNPDNHIPLRDLLELELDLAPEVAGPAGVVATPRR
jgi:hypothetical protein